MKRLLSRDVISFIWFVYGNYFKFSLKMNKIEIKHWSMLGYKLVIKVYEWFRVVLLCYELTLLNHFMTLVILYLRYNLVDVFHRYVLRHLVILSSNHFDKDYENLGCGEWFMLKSIWFFMQIHSILV